MNSKVLNFLFVFTAFHDFIVFGMISLFSFSAGGMLNYNGWLTVNVAVIPLLLIAFITILISKRNYRLSLSIRRDALNN